MLNHQEREILRTLAQQYMEQAETPRQEALQKLWIDHNNGCGQRPMVLIDQIPWNEMDVDGSLQCQVQDPYWRNVERTLRQKLYQYRYMPADMLLPPYVLIPRILKDPEYRSFGIQIQETTAATDAANDVVSHSYIKQLSSMEDLEKIRFTAPVPDFEKEAQVMETAKQVFEGIAPVYWEGISMHSGLWDTISMWQGVEECYFMLMDEPELIHAMMERMTQATLEMIRQGNEYGVFDTASGLCHCSHTITAPFTQEMAQRPGISQNSWTFGMAQLFTSVSPSITEEFELPYVSRIFEQFGNVYYGCCERLEDRLDLIAKLPNVRKVSCSPWNNPETFASNLPRHLIMSYKPNPALIACNDMDAMKRELKAAIQAAKDHHLNLEMILKDNSSVQYEPQRLWEFSRMALELVNSL